MNIIPETDETPAATVSEAEDRQDNPITNVPLYLERLEDELAIATDLASVDEVWASHCETSDGRLSREDQEKAVACYDKHVKRFRDKLA